MTNMDCWRGRVLAAAIVLQFVFHSLRSEAQNPQPTDVVQKLYSEVVAHHPLGVPRGSAKIAIWPLLSKRLINALETRNACDLDWVRHHKNMDPPLKAPGFYEDGLFSGSNERGHVDGAAVRSAELQADGSYLVYVNLWSYFDGGDLSLRTDKKYRWRVAARVTFDNGRYVVDDILGFKGVFDNGKSIYMSKMLTTGCKGAHSTFD